MTWWGHYLQYLCNYKLQTFHIPGIPQKTCLWYHVIQNFNWTFIHFIQVLSLFIVSESIWRDETVIGLIQQDDNIQIQISHYASSARTSLKWLAYPHLHLTEVTMTFFDCLLSFLNGEMQMNGGVLLLLDKNRNTKLLKYNLLLTQRIVLVVAGDLIYWANSSCHIFWIFTTCKTLTTHFMLKKKKKGKFITNKTNQHHDTNGWLQYATGTRSKFAS